MSHVSCKSVASMGACTRPLFYGALLLILLGLGWPGLQNPTVKAARLREHYIAAQDTRWSYTLQPDEQSRLQNSGPVFKKICYREYEVDFQREKPTNPLSGLLGPTLHAEVGDTLVVHFKNLANKPLSIHPQGIVYNKWSEGSSYSDRTSPIEKLDDAVPPGQMYKYVWEITAKIGPREADPPCLTYVYYSHEDMVQDFNSGLVGALLICKEGSLNENGTQKLFDREYVLMFAVFDESKSWHKAISVMYTINGYANGTLPDVEACTYDRISWHLIGMSSLPEIFSIHFNGQTLEQNHYKVSTVGLVAGGSTTANMSVSHMGRWLISSLTQNHLQAAMHGYLNIKECGKQNTLMRKLSFKETRMIKHWEYFIAAEEITWDYAPEMSENTYRQYKAQSLDNFSNLIGKKYKKAVFRQYEDASFNRRIEVNRPKEHGILGPVIRAEVRDTINIIFKNMASKPYSIYVHGVTLSKEAEGAVYLSDFKENKNQSKAVQPGETYTYKWTVLDTDEPAREDAQCVTRLYHSAVDVTRDIASGLVGPLLICKRKALDKKGIQKKADVEQQAVFAVFDENKSWYLEDNIKQYCSNPTDVKRGDRKFYRSNVIHTINGYMSDRREILGFCQDELVEWHLSSIGSQDEIVSVHLSGHTFLNRGKDRDILNLFPMSGESATVNMDNVGTWLLASGGSREMSNGMRMRFRDAKCNNEDYTSDELDGYDVFVPSPEKPPTVVSAKEERPKEDRATTVQSVAEDSEENLVKLFELDNVEKNPANPDVVKDEDYDYQASLASSLGLRTFRGSTAEEEEQNLTAIAMQETYSISSVSNVTGHTDLVFTNSSDTFQGDKMLQTKNTTYFPNKVESHDLNYTSLFSNIASKVSNDSAHVSVDRENSTSAIVAIPYSREAQGKNVSVSNTLAGKREKRELSEAKLYAIRKMCALLFHVQHKKNSSALGNTTLDTMFFAIPSAENASSLESLENRLVPNDYDEDKDEINTEFPMHSTNLTFPVEVAEETNGYVPNHSAEAELSKPSNLTLNNVFDSLVSALVPNTVNESLKSLPPKGRRCPSPKRNYEWNFVSEKKSYDTGVDLTNELSDSSRNATMHPENTVVPSKGKQEMQGGYSQPELAQQEVSSKHKHSSNVNCSVSTSETFLKVRRRKKKENSSVFMTPRGFKPQAKEVNNTLTPRQFKPYIKIGLPNENGDYNEYDPENSETEDSADTSFEYQIVRYDNPYATDSRLDVNKVRNADDIAGRYLRTVNKGYMRKYYIAAEEVFWDYDTLRKSTVKNDPTSEVYKKVIFRSYQDDTFRTRETEGEYEEHLGILGPVIRAEIDDVIQVQFKNLASRPYSLHAHGVYYEKSSEGRNYDDESPEWFKNDDAVQPNDTYTYVWHAVKRSGPLAGRKVCKSWAYYSGVNPEKDIQSGLIGPILICQKGMLDKHHKPIEMREFVLLFMVFDEEKSWYFNKRATKTCTGKVTKGRRCHTFPAINGIPYELQGLRMYKDEMVHWHLLNMGGPRDIHVINFHGQTFREQGMNEHQLGVYPLLPGSFHTVEMKPSKAGIWLLDTEVGEYQQAGMQASFIVIDKECKTPMGLAGGIVQDSQLSASSHTAYWEPKLARLNNVGKYNAWSTVVNENEYPWMQVDLRRQVLITGVQTQGAKQVLKALYIKEYFITYSTDGRKWIAFKGNSLGAQKLFEGNSDGQGIKENHIDPPIIARYIRLYSTVFHNRPALRLELLGCEIEGCSVPLGMESGAIEDPQITASSYKKNWFSSWEPTLARLNKQGRVNAWQAKSNNNRQWLQIDLLRSKKITGIIIQGAKSMTTEMYVKMFSIRYSNDNSAWKSYLDDSTSMERVFTGNTDSSGQVKHFLNPPIFSRFIRVIPKMWNQSIALRLELFGCEGQQDKSGSL